MRNRKRYIFQLCGLLVLYNISDGQSIIFKEDFETYDSSQFINSPKKLTTYNINSYSPKDKSTFSIFSEVNKGLDSKNELENCCIDTSKYQHGFFSGITLFEKPIPSTRLYFVAELDTGLLSMGKYNIAFDIKYHPFVNYRIDSIQILLLKQSKDIDSWLTGKQLTGMSIGVTLKGIDNKDWKSISKEIIPDNDYRYIIIGNLKEDNETTVVKQNNCNCSKKPKGFWEYSYLFIDNIVISKN